MVDCDHEMVDGERRIKLPSSHDILPSTPTSSSYYDKRQKYQDNIFNSPISSSSSTISSHLPSHTNLPSHNQNFVSQVTMSYLSQSHLRSLGEMRW